jgi:acyl-CoA thioesterase FadM
MVTLAGLMLPVLRYAKVFLRLGRRPPVDLREGSVIEFRVWPNDLDLNGHLTNSRYFALMDAARYDMVIRSGTWEVWRLNGWAPVVASQRIRFRRSLRPWARYAIRTRTLGWDERNLYIQHTFERGGVVHAEATIRAAILGRDRKPVSLPELMKASGWTEGVPELPERIKKWIEVELADFPDS